MSLFYRICGYGCYLLAIGVILIGIGLAHNLVNSYNADLVATVVMPLGATSLIALLPFLLGRLFLKYARL